MSESGSYPYFEDRNEGLLRLWGGRSGLRVLDAGCGFATTSREIQQLGNHVTGIEASLAAASVASQRLTRIVTADLTDFPAVSAAIGEERFDVVIFADVLEHLPAPADALRRYQQFLRPGGSVIVSLPNVALWSVRFSLILGRWEYQETGVLDRTHLRFFTRRSARMLLREAGLTTVAATTNPGLVRPFVPLAKRLFAGGETHDPGAILASRPYRFYLAAVEPVERAIASLWPGMLAFQMVFEAKTQE
jgi:SAM-dependent methyltransferase